MPVSFSNMGNSTTLNRFTAAIETLTAERENMLLQQAGERRRIMLQQAEERIKREMDYLFKERISDTGSSIAEERSSKINQMRAQLFKERETYARRVFATAEEEIISFVSGKSYDNFMQSLARQLASQYDCRGAEVSLRSADMHLRDKLALHFPLDCAYTISEDIRLGGLMLWLPEQSILIDERLETRLAEQHLWFREHSELSAVW